MGYIFERGKLAAGVTEVRLSKPGELDLVIEGATFVAGGWLRDSSTKYTAHEENGDREVVAELGADRTLATVDTTNGDWSRKNVVPFATVGTSKDFTYTAKCPWSGCEKEFTGGTSAVGQRLCPHCKNPIFVERPKLPA